MPGSIYGGLTGASYNLSQADSIQCLIFCLAEDVLKTVLNNFRRWVDARVIAPDAFRKGIISERVKHKILHAETQDDANDFPA